MLVRVKLIQVTSLWLITSDKAERALSEFKPADLAEALREYTSCENDLRLKRELLQSSGLNESDPAALLEKVKERGQGPGFEWFFIFAIIIDRNQFLKKNDFERV